MARKIARKVGLALFFAAFVGASVMAGGVWYLFDRLPSPAELKENQLQVPLRVYTNGGHLIGEFGEKRRIPLSIEEIPDILTKAVLAAEDKHFFEHPGVDWEGLARAVLHLVRTGEKGPGGSTITMQVARNFFLGREKTYLRKANEILLALRIEQELTKDEILILYLNKIFFGRRAYGVGAAAQVYYGADLRDLALPQIAMIAGLPKAPSRFNPIADPEQAIVRRNYVLERMLELEYISEEDYAAAIEAPITARQQGYSMDVDAPYVAEMVRTWMEDRFGHDVYSAGFQVHTTINKQNQESANEAMRRALLAYERRHGYRGPEGHVGPVPDNFTGDFIEKAPIAGLVSALVKKVEKKTVIALTKEWGEVTIEWEGLSWARRHEDMDNMGPKIKTASDVLTPGDVIRVEHTESGWWLSQVPKVQGALVAMSPEDGAVRALVGGFDFYLSNFNRAIQAHRQPGSSFKPFVYAVALEAGFTPASIENDAPIIDFSEELERHWRPENYSGKFYGPTRLREALVHSRNLVSIRLLRHLVKEVGMDSILANLVRFGFDPERLPPDLSLSLGTGVMTPLDLATAYAIFANGGYRVESYFVERVEGPDGNFFTANPIKACRSCETQLEDRLVNAIPLEELPEESGANAGEYVSPDAFPPPARVAPRVISAESSWLMNSMLIDVIDRGTGKKAKRLKRTDLAGKTGTTNDQKDAWFCGFTPHIVATAWVGFDQYHPLGQRETGGYAALPMWTMFMEKALDGVPEKHLDQPEGLVTVRIDAETGKRIRVGHPEDSLLETFRPENLPDFISTGTSDVKPRDVTEQLFQEQ